MNIILARMQKNLDADELYLTAAPFLTQTSAAFRRANQNDFINSLTLKRDFQAFFLQPARFAFVLVTAVLLLL
jgi:hypothetical protein